MATAIAFLAMDLSFTAYGALASRPGAQDPARVLNTEGNRRVAKPMLRIGLIWTACASAAVLAAWIAR